MTALSNVLVIAEHDNATVKGATLNTVSAALEVLKPSDLGVDVKAHLKTLKVSEPPKRSAGIKVPDVATLVSKLKNDAKVI